MPGLAESAQESGEEESRIVCIGKEEDYLCIILNLCKSLLAIRL